MSTHSLRNAGEKGEANSFFVGVPFSSEECEKGKNGWRAVGGAYPSGIGTEEKNRYDGKETG